MKKTAFISYQHSSSKQLAHDLRLRLRAADIDVYSDEDLIAGEDVLQKPRYELNQRTYYIVILAPTTLANPDGVRAELEIALKRNKPIIPVFINGYTPTDLPDVFASVRQRKGIFYDGTNLESVIQQIERAMQIESQGERFNSLTKLTRRTLSIIVTVLVLLLAFLALFSEEWLNDAFYKIGIYTATPDLTITYTITQTALAATTPLTATSDGPPMATFTTNVSVREGPDVLFEPPIGSFAANETTQVLAVNPDATWYKVRFEGGEGWVFGDLMVISGNVSNLHVDSGPIPPTPVPPTHTLTPTTSPTATNTPSPTNTSVPPTDRVVAPTGDTITLTIYRDEDSFTLYVPQTDAQVSLADFAYQISRLGGAVTRQLNQDYGAFMGMPFHNIGGLAQAICFRLVRNGANVPAPQNCQDALMVTQNLADADVFWYDSASNVAHSVQILRDGNLVSLCPAGRAQCDIEW